MEASRFRLVDSLYGPGTVCAWLLTLTAVVVSWTLNKASRRRDTISVDFLLALVLPLIAAGHLIALIVQLPISVVEAFTTRNIEHQQYGSAIEAPLSICETFSVFALILAGCGGPWWGSHLKIKRLGLVLAVGLLSWSAENILFGIVTMKGVKLVDTTLTRPYLFFVTPLVAWTWAYLSLCLGAILMYGVHVAWSNARSRTTKKCAKRYQGREKKDCDKLVKQLRLDQAARISPSMLEAVDVRFRDFDYHSLRNQNKTLLKCMYIYIVLACGMVATSAGFTFDSSIVEVALDDSRPTPLRNILIPRSNVSFRSLDQQAALLGGFVVLIAAVWSAYRAYKRTPPGREVRRRYSI
ncbi:hypothetical protein FB567DRAFT_533134 [Paraphoma chrysanthemicola]|uniref:Uncharacterized protein n=1 Tax=Paraphoma chrysanthemicola TaxID=798071 RepID=A0A8K0VV68_9PLEO|nr:hypothetical protein FB567DRAFT_533134 [Paraphoma chrysanthemicola]